WLFSFREAWLRTVALDFDGARALCDTVTRQATEYPTGQPQTIAKVATAYARFANRQYPDALQTFAHVLDTIPKFFLHWYWRMNTQLGLSETWPAAGKVRNARTEAERFVPAASSPPRRRQSGTSSRSSRIWRRESPWRRRTGRTPNNTSRARSRSSRSSTSPRPAGESMPRGPTSLDP